MPSAADGWAGTGRWALALAGTGVRAMLAQRGAFWLQAALMLGNNLIFFTFWLLLFHRVEAIGEWRLPDVAALYGCTAAAYGLAVIAGGGLRELPRIIEDGGLDPLLAQPRAVLPTLAATRPYASGVGDLVSAVILFAWSGHLHGWNWIALPLLAVCGALTFGGTIVLAGSLAFWANGMHGLARQVFEYAVTLSVYPGSVFPGVWRILVTAVLPSAFVAQIPAAVVRAPSLAGCALVAAGAAAYVATSLWVFRLGLRRYAAGTRFTTGL